MLFSKKATPTKEASRIITEKLTFKKNKHSASKQDLPGENLISEMLSFLSLNPTIFSRDSESKMRNPPSFWPTATEEPSGEYVTARPPFFSFLTCRRNQFNSHLAYDVHNGTFEQLQMLYGIQIKWIRHGIWSYFNHWQKLPLNIEGNLKIIL